MSTARHGKKKNREFAIISWVSNDLIFVKHKLIDLEQFLRVQILTGRSKISEWTISSPMESIHAYFYGNQFTREPKYYVLRVSLNELFALVELINFAPPACWPVACYVRLELNSRQLFSFARTFCTVICEERLSPFSYRCLGSSSAATIPHLFQFAIVSEDSSICWSWADGSTWVRYLVNLLWTGTL